MREIRRGAQAGWKVECSRVQKGGEPGNGWGKRG